MIVLSLTFALALVTAPHRPFLEATDSQGVKHRLPETGVKLAVFHFWATWCHPCRAELPELGRFVESRAYRKLAQRGLALYVLAVDAPETHLEPYLNKLRLDGKRWAMRSTLRTLKQHTGTESIPITIVYNPRTGAIIARWVGRQKWTAPELHRQLRRWLTEDNR